MYLGLTTNRMRILSEISYIKAMYEICSVLDTGHPFSPPEQSLEYELAVNMCLGYYFLSLVAALDYTTEFLCLVSPLQLSLSEHCHPYMCTLLYISNSGTPCHHFIHFLISRRVIFLNIGM